MNTDLKLMPRATNLRSRPESAESYLARLEQEALNHRAMNHPWIDAIENGRFADTRSAIRDFALQYSGYSAWFPNYLTAVISRLERDDHKELLGHNLEEEQGHLHEEDRDQLAALGIDPNLVDGVPHPVLFKRFSLAMGINAAERTNLSTSTRTWREQFRHFLQTNSAAAAVGALGLGTETIVAALYTRLLRGLNKFSGLQREDLVFFDLHCHVDDQHQKDLLQVAADLMIDSEARHEIRRGMRMALDLRARFFDDLYARACTTGLTAATA